MGIEYRVDPTPVPLALLLHKFVLVRRIHRLVVTFWALFRQYRALRYFRRAPERRPDAPARFAKRARLRLRERVSYLWA